MRVDELRAVDSERWRCDPQSVKLVVTEPKGTRS